MNPSVARNFSRYAHLYEQYADVQNIVGRRLLDHALLPPQVSTILEIGCGPGNFTSMLLDRFQTARVMAVDIAEAMIETACRKVTTDRVAFQVEDAETMPVCGRFDLITSNASFQWLTDMNAMFVRCANLLSSGNSLLFSAFGPRTFVELNACLKILLPNACIPAERFLHKDQTGDFLRRIFGRVKESEILHEETHETVLDLLKKIKYTGETGDGLTGNAFLGRDRLAELDRIYKQRFGGIRTTYQVFLFQAWKI